MTSAFSSLPVKAQPWLERSGRLSPLKLAVFIGLFLPGLWTALALSQGWLGPKPVTEAIHSTGEWAVRFILLSLAVTPLRRIGQWSRLILVRRMLGLAALAYVLIHFTLYVVSQHFDLLHVASEIVLRIYLTIGFVALVGLCILGATSTDAMIRRLGPHRWSRLHQTIYVITILGLLHYFLQSKLDVTRPVLMAGLFILLMGHRLLQRFKIGETIWALTGLAVGSAGLTALAEAGWYAAKNKVPASLVLQANLDVSDTLRPAWWVLIVGLGVVGIRIARAAWAKKPPVVRPRAAA